MSGFCLRPGGWPAQYSARRKRQWCAASTVASSARKTARVQKGLLLRGGLAVQNPIAMRKTAEPADDVGVVEGVFQLFGVVGLAEQLDATELVWQMLRVHERHVQEFEQHGIDPRVGAAVDGAARHLARHRVARKGEGVAAEHVAGKLVEHDGERQRGLVGSFPR